MTDVTSHETGAVPPKLGRLLLVDDEPAILDTVGRFLKFIGYEVRTASAVREALAEARDFLPELILLDVMLPDGDGFEVMRRLRADGVPHAVIFLTARDTRADLVKGLTAGGDDYVTKPFGLDEVAARISAVLRRTRRAEHNDRMLRVADLELDTATYSVRRAGTLVDLSPTEFRLLRYLMLHSGRVVPRARLLEHVWSYDFNGDDTVVATYVSYLRRKLDPLGPPLIHTQRGIGYSIQDRDPRC
ncbi:response regulator transcription factor [Streptomyces sp. ME02-8801-2C]|uniref:response regulator transcription factor n=1 Tax=Streptomyces sp. ME02-8801-2C TaxID=3028680 RepID=UPI0029AAC20C|nr:response regulator transcription factor [Streptomyces sp. ME02-8801-2C]MDX3457132.1 response regulator transcription factor [Streptomyces sp. ME02-8801-2C]